MREFLDNFYSVIIEPSESFNRIKEDKPLKQALLIVIIISAMSPFLSSMLEYNRLPFNFLIISSIFSVFGGIISWLLFGCFMEILSFIFDKNGKFKEILCLTAFALIPWFFIAPVYLLKQSGPVFEGIGIILSLGVWIWAMTLFFLGIAVSYGLTTIKTLTLAFLPFIASMVQLQWVIYFIKNFIASIKA